LEVFSTQSTDEYWSICSRRNYHFVGYQFSRKIITGLETFYDVLTSIEKIGQVSDLKTEEVKTNQSEFCFTNIALEMEKVCYRFPDSNDAIIDQINLKINPNEKILLEGENGSGKTTLIRLLSGLLQPTSGSLYINDDTYRKIDLTLYRSQISTIINGETPFEGTILENITFNNPLLSNEDIKWAIESVHLGSFIKSLPDGLNTKIFPEGRQLSSSNAQKILLARSIINKPRILFYEDPLDKMDDSSAREIIDFITDSSHKWTVIVSSKNPYWKEKIQRVIYMKNGKIINDTKNK